MSESPYRDFCNEDYTSGRESKAKKLVVSHPVPLLLSNSYSTIPYADGGSPSPSPDRENVSMIPYGTAASDENFNSQPTLERSGNNMSISSPTDTVNTVIHNPENGESCGSLVYHDSLTHSHRSVGNFEPMIRPEEPMSAAPLDVHEDEIHAERNSESQRLMNQNSVEKVTKNHTKTNTNMRRMPSRAISYSPGSCCFCVSNMKCVNIFLWISLVMALIGWSVSIWMSIDSMEYISSVNLRTGYGMEGFPFSDITIIVISVATFLFSIVFLIIATYTSQTLSSYHLPTSQTNKCAYCFTTAMAVFSCIAVVLWTLIIAVTMIPTTVITIIHLLFSSGNVNCIHLPSYGISTDPLMTNGNKDSPLQLHCDDDLKTWLGESWSLMTPLLASLGCAIFIEIILMGFIMVVSSNGRHLYERMGYLMSSKISHDDKAGPKEQRQPFI